MAATTSERNLNAYVEDCDSDQSEHPVLSSFRGRSSPGANVAAKRSSPSDLGTDKPFADREKVVPIDLQSEVSGYSSHTAGTMSSADSASSAKMSHASTAPSSAASMPPPSPATTKRRPAPVEDRRKPSESPRKTVQRSSSTASKRPPGTRRPTNPQPVECKEPNCKECGPNAPPQRRGRRDYIALDSGRDVSNAPFDGRSQRSDPSTTYTSPPSPSYNRQPAPYMQGSTMIQPAQSRPRAASTTRRPISYHGDYWNSGMPAPYPSPPQEYGPPPSMPAHFAAMPHQQHAHMSPYMMAGTPPSQYYHGGHAGHPMVQQMQQHMSQATPPYDQQRPPMSARNSSNYQGRMSGSGFGPALLTHDNTSESQALPSARYGNVPQSAKQERFPPPKQLTQTPHQGSESSEEYESSSEDEVHAPPAPKQIMPPPAPKNKSQKEARPVLRHARTTQVTQVYNDRQDRRDRRTSMSQSQTLPERPREKDTRTSRGSTAPVSRSMSVSRPKPPQRVAKSSYDVPRGTVIVESNRASRPQYYPAYEPAPRRTSYVPYGYDDESSGSESDDDAEQVRLAQEAARRQNAERRREEERRLQEERKRQEELQAQEDRRRRRRSTVYQDDYDVIPVVESAPRRRTDSSARRVEPTTYGNAMDAVEAYQQQIRGSEIPLTEKNYKVAKQQASREPSDPDRKTRISQSARTTLTNGTTNGDIRLRVDASAPLSLSFNGDMEGRTLQINPAEDGLADIIISGNRGEENVYRSEKGSVRGKRNSLIANSTRREAEEVSVKSGRSSQGRREREMREVREVESRRDAERRQLRRTQKYNY